jgi:hypothetical protein
MAADMSAADASGAGSAPTGWIDLGIFEKDRTE